MKSFKEHLSELKVWMPPKGSGLGISRINMPQVKADDYPDYVKYLKDMRIVFKAKTVDPNILLPIQREFNIQGVERSLNKMAALVPGAKDKSIIISKDNYIVDGHHRWIAYKNVGKKINVMQANVDMKKLLDATNKYPKVYNKNNQNK